MRRSFIFAACAAMVLTVGRPSSAATITDTSAASDFSISWSFACGAAGTCTGDASFDVTSFSSTELIMDVTVNNTLDTALALFLEGLGWDMDPAATGAELTTPGAFLDEVRLDVNFPTAGTLNICVDDNGGGGGGDGSCGSGQPNGIPSPGSDFFTIKLTGDFGDSVDLTDFTLKYSGEPDSFEGPGEETTGGTDTGATDTGATDTGATTGGEIPEPTSMLLLGSGLAAAAMRMRRNRK